TLLQESLIERGLAEVAYLYGDYKYTARLETVQKMAKENKVGFWSEETEKVEKVSSKTKKKKEEKTFVQKLVDQLLAKVFDYIENLLDKIASWIENVLY
ncbi:MAG: thermonuclease family protein, partial [bacterium]|nr:thermonuclease family protein [bacterium]